MIDITKLTEEHKGIKVVCTSSITGFTQKGIIHSWDKKNIFVKYSERYNPKKTYILATSPENLRFIEKKRTKKQKKINRTDLMIFE